MSGLRVRPEEPADRDAIRTVHERAFGQALEADLVERLRRDADLVLSLVAVREDLVGHVAFSRLELAEASVRAVALAPIAVVPELQRTGIGTALVREALERIAAAGEDLVVVLADPAYYGRFGFRTDVAQGLKTPYDGPYLQALALSERGRTAKGVVSYAPAFADLA